MSISYRDNDGTKITVYVQDLTVEDMTRYMEYIEEKMHYVCDTSRMFHKDRRK